MDKVLVFAVSFIAGMLAHGMVAARREVARLEKELDALMMDESYCAKRERFDREFFGREIKNGDSFTVTADPIVYISAFPDAPTADIGIRNYSTATPHNDETWGRSDVEDVEKEVL